MALSKTNIEYGINPDGSQGYGWQIYTGCWNWQYGICGGGGQQFNCWAMLLAEGRLARHRPYGFEPTFYLRRIDEPLSLRKPSRILTAFQGDLFGPWMSEEIHTDLGKRIQGREVTSLILETVRLCPQHQFLFLTKCPWNLTKWDWPNNAWVGATVTNLTDWVDMCNFLPLVTRARVRWLSLEPLLGAIPTEVLAHSDWLNWIVIGAATRPLVLPPRAWVDEIGNAADRLGIPVFEKNNLRPLITERPLRQEAPK